MTVPPRLSPASLPVGVPRFAHPRAGIGIVHFGIGAFMRAHQAWYSDRAMDAAGGDWLALGVSLRSAGVRDQLEPQGGLYTVAEKSAAGLALRVTGSVAGVVVAGEAPQRVVETLAAPGTHIVTFTVTEKGYCRAADGRLDRAAATQGFYPLLAAGLAARRSGGLPGLTLLSCDNLADNGATLRRLLLEWLGGEDAGLAAWADAHCTFPASMVDRIVPATTDADRAAIAATLGVRDDGLVVTEPFSQWVIEDRFAGPRPAWGLVGAELVADVAPYETAKLRMLNGAHSALAYLGLRAGHEFVHQAIADPALRMVADRLMREEAAPTVAAAPGQDLAAYAAALLARFANPALDHRLIQIAMDGSQKIPQRWLATLAAARAAGRRCPAILTAFAGWLAHVRGDNAARHGPVSDPRAGALAALWQAGDAGSVIDALFAAGGLFAGGWTPDATDRAAILAALA